MDRRKFLAGSFGGLLAFLGLGACTSRIQGKPIKAISGKVESCCPKCKHIGEHEIWIDWLASVADRSDPKKCVFNWRELRICPQCNYKYGVFTALIDFSQNGVADYSTP